MAEKDVKLQITEAASKFFSRFGFNKTNMEEIARHIHKAKGLIYYYFNSKEQLFNEVLKLELNLVKTELSAVCSQDTDAITLIEKYIITRYTLLNNAPNYHETLKADFFEKYHFVKDVRDDFALFEAQQMEKILKKGLDDGSIAIKSKDIKRYVEIIMMIVNSIEIPFFLQNKFTEYQENILEIAEILFKGLKNQKA